LNKSGCIKVPKINDAEDLEKIKVISTAFFFFSK